MASVSLGISFALDDACHAGGPTPLATLTLKSSRSQPTFPRWLFPDRPSMITIRLPRVQGFSRSAHCARTILTVCGPDSIFRPAASDRSDGSSGADIRCPRLTWADKVGQKLSGRFIGIMSAGELYSCMRRPLRVTEIGFVFGISMNRGRATLFSYNACRNRPVAALF